MMQAYADDVPPGYFRQANGILGPGHLEAAVRVLKNRQYPTGDTEGGCWTVLGMDTNYGAADQEAANDAIIVLASRIILGDIRELGFLGPGCVFWDRKHTSKLYAVAPSSTLDDSKAAEISRELQVSVYPMGMDSPGIPVLAGKPEIIETSSIEVDTRKPIGLEYDPSKEAYVVDSLGDAYRSYKGRRFRPGENTFAVFQLKEFPDRPEDVGARVAPSWDTLFEQPYSTDDLGFPHTERNKLIALLRSCGKGHAEANFVKRVEERLSDLGPKLVDVYSLGELSLERSAGRTGPG